MSSMVRLALNASLCRFRCPPSERSPSRQVAIENNPGQTAVVHSYDMSGPSELRCEQKRFYAGNLTSVQDFCIWNLVLPFDVSYLSEASHIKLVRLSDMATI